MPTFRASEPVAAEDSVEREANYVAVGSFLLLVLVLGGLFVYWYSDSREHRDYTRYEIYFDGSVFGLSEGGSVRYLGVDVGRVVRMRIDNRAADRVQVVADIDSTTPVSERTVAQLSLQGVTGLLYIDLQQQAPADTGRHVLEVPSERYPVIRSVHSNFDVFISSLPDLAQRVGELVVRASALFSEENIAAVQRAVNNVDRAAGTLPGTTRDIATLVAELRETAAEANRAVANVRTATDTAGPDFAAALANLRTTSNNLADASKRLGDFVEENRQDLSGFVRDGLPQVQSLVRDSRQAVQDIRDLSRSLKDNPSRLIYQPAAAGVEIPP
jgi:phospholipid/cholesterol/gamma-HCH transport system substrate-binding protein